VNANLYALLRDHFPEDGEQPCILIPGGRVIHYDELDAWSARMARVLVDCGCVPGDRVAVQVDKCWQVLALYLACLRAGLVYLPLNTAYKKAELAYFFSDAEPRLIVCRPESAAFSGALRPEATVLTLDEDGGTLVERAQEVAPTFATVTSAPSDLAAIIYTSGTTGRAKGAMLTHRNLATNALTLVEHWGFTRGDVLLHALPIYHVHGLFVACHCTLLAGSRMLWLPRFDAKTITELLPHTTVMMGVPTFYTRLLAEESFDNNVCATIRIFISGSAPLLPATFDAFQTRSGRRILERYGMTETGMITSNPLDGERRSGSVGQALPGVSIRVTDDSGKPCAAGSVGDIEVKGPNVFPGYWRMPERNADEFTPDGYFKTGDMGELESDGYLKIVGRAKDLIISGGLNVYPKEIEDRIDAVPGVVETAVIGVPDPDLGEAVTAVVVAAAGHNLTEEFIIDALKSEIAGFKVPKHVHFASDLPRNAMGKVQKNVLRSRYAQT
jgi:malonyl-CoA/methylmalonyl-CoA synthetase